MRDTGTARIDFRRTGAEGPAHAVDLETDRTLCAPGHDASDWATAPRPDRDPEVRTCRHGCSEGVDLIVGAEAEWRPTAWLVLPERRRTGHGRETHVSCDGGETTICRCEGGYWGTLRFRLVTDRRTPTAELDPSCESCRDLLRRRIIR